MREPSQIPIDAELGSPEPSELSDAEWRALESLPWGQLSAANESRAEGPASHVDQAILASCTEHLTPVKPMAMNTRLWLTLLFSLGIVLLAILVRSSSVLTSAPVVKLASYVGYDLAGLYASSSHTIRTALFGTIGWALVMLSVLLLGFYNPPGKRRLRTLRLSIAFGLPVVFFSYLLFMGSHESSLVEFFTHAEHTYRASECGIVALGTGGLSSAAVLFVWRHSDPLAPRLSGALAGLLGGLSAAIAAGIVCPTTGDWHLLFAHGVVVALFTLIGALIGRRVLAP